MTEKVNATVDIREPETVWDAVEAHPDVADMAISELTAADLLIEGVGFERKTPSDFASSMTDRDDHLKNQVAKMKQAPEIDRAYILIEGGMSDFEFLQHTQVPAKSLRGFAASLMARNNTPVVFCSDGETLVDMAVRLARKHVEDESTSSLRVNSAAGLEEPFVKRCYGCIEGVGPAMADTLYETYPTLTDALAASHDDLTALDGVGDVTAERIRTTLHGDTHATLP